MSNELAIAHNPILFRHPFKFKGSRLREEGLSNPAVPELRGLITPPLEGDCKLVKPKYQI